MTEGIPLASMFLEQSVDYPCDNQGAIDRVQTALQRNHIILIKNFPPSKDELARFCANFGSLLPAYGTRIESIEDVVGDVWVNPNVSEQKRLRTEGNSELGLHTAKAWRIDRPRYFGLLMVDPGWRDQENGNNGESLFTHLNDILSEMKLCYPESFEEDSAVLRRTPVKLPIRHAKDEIDYSPLLFDIGDEGIGLRYKENTKELIAQAVSTIPDGQKYYEALSRFYEAAQHARCRLEIPLEAGDLALLDNRRITHARNPFPFNRHEQDGSVVPNPRHLFNIHFS